MLTREQVDALGHLQGQEEVLSVRYHDDRHELVVGYRAEGGGMNYAWVGADGKDIEGRGD